MFICKECGKSKRNLTLEDKKCRNCGSEHFTTKEMEKAEKVFERIVK